MRRHAWPRKPESGGDEEGERLPQCIVLAIAPASAKATQVHGGERRCPPLDRLPMFEEDPRHAPGAGVGRQIVARLRDWPVDGERAAKLPITPVEERCHPREGGAHPANRNDVVFPGELIGHGRPEGRQERAERGDEAREECEPCRKAVQLA